MSIAAKRIAFLGLELEGGWDRLFRDCAPQHDGSVRHPISRKTGVATEHLGEIPSPKLKPEEAEKWLRDHFPDGTNDSCGFHIHMSFKKNLDYGRLMSRKFFNLFLKEAKTWGEKEGIPKGDPFWHRLTGNNQYCRKVFVPHKQIHQTRKGNDRYTMFNYCFGLHQTVECRLAPMFSDVERAVSWVKFLVETVEGFLASQPKEKAMRFTLQQEDIQTMDAVKKEFEVLRGGRFVPAPPIAD